MPNVPNSHYILNPLLLHVPSPCLPILPLPSLATTAQQTTPFYITISHNRLVEGLLGGTFEKSTLSTTDSHWPTVQSDVAPMTFSTRKNTGFDENRNPTTIHAAKKKGLATVATCDGERVGATNDKRHFHLPRHILPEHIRPITCKWVFRGNLCLRVR